MKVSIITTCYNRRGTIGDAIRSVLAQEYDDIEYIVIDGASKDGSVEVIRGLMAEGGRRKAAIKRGQSQTSLSYAEREQARCEASRKRSFKFVSEPDGGMYEAINKGIRMATGDIIGLVHSDDMLYDCHVIEDVARTFEESGADFVYGDGVFVNAEHTNRVVRNWRGGGYHRWKVRMGWLPLHPTCYIRRDVMMREGLYDESYRIAADTELLVRYLYKVRLKVAYMKRRVIRMRMGGLSTDSEKRRLMWREDIRLYKAHGFWALPTKVMKVMWKVPQFITAKFMTTDNTDYSFSI